MAGPEGWVSIRKGGFLKSGKQSYLRRERKYWEAQDEFEWLSETGIETVLNLIPPITGDVLELCSGSGMFTKRIPGEFDSYTCLDLSRPLLENLQQTLPDIIPVVGNAENLNFLPSSFDRVLVFAGLHHVPNETRAIEAAFTLLRPGGLFIAFEPNANCWYRKPMLKFKDLLGLYTQDEHFLHPETIYQKMRLSGFKKVDLKYCTPEYNPAHLRTHLNKLLSSLMRIASNLSGSPSWQSFFVICGQTEV